MPDDAPILGTTWVEIRPDVSKLGPAFDQVEKKAQGTGRVVENTLGNSFDAASKAAVKLENAVVAGSPRMQYGVYQLGAAMKNLDAQIKAATASGSTLTSDQVRQYAQLKSKIDELTPAVESGRRSMIAMRAEVQAGAGVWTNWESVIGRVLGELGFSGAGEAALKVGGGFAALEAGLAVGEKLSKVLGTDKQAMESFWHDVADKGKEVQSNLDNWLANKWATSASARIATFMLTGYMPVLGTGYTAPGLTARGQKGAAKAGGAGIDPLDLAYKNATPEITRANLEILKQQAEIRDDTKEVEFFTRALENAQYVEQGYTDAKMRNGDATRKYLLDQNAATRAMQREKEATEAANEAAEKRAKLLDELSFKAAGAGAKSLREGNKDWADTKINITGLWDSDTFLKDAKHLADEQLKISRKLKTDEMAIAVEAANDEARVRENGYSEQVRKGEISLAEYQRLVIRSEEVLGAKVAEIHEQYGHEFENFLARKLRSYGTNAQQIEALESQLVDDMTSNLETGFFDVLIGDTKGAKNAFKSMLDSMLREVVNFMVNREVQQFLGMLLGSTGSFWSQGIVTTPVGGMGGVEWKTPLAPTTGVKGSSAPTGVHISLEPGLVARIVAAGGEAGYGRVVGDLNDNGPVRQLTLRRA